MDEQPTEQVVEDNNQPAPTGEPTLADQPAAVPEGQPEQAAEGTQAPSSEPSESPSQPNPEQPDKRTRFQRRIDQKNAQIAALRQQAQPSPANFLPQAEIPEFEDPEFNQAVRQTADAISRANIAQFANTMQQRDTVNSYINNVGEDTAFLRGKHDVLNPAKEEVYDPELEAKIVDFFDRANPIVVNGRMNPNYDPNYRLKDAAEEYLADVMRYERKGQENSSRDLAAAADSAVLTPSGVAPHNKEETADQMRERLANVKF